MIFNSTELNDVYLIDINKLQDERGFFARAFCMKEFEKKGIKFPVAQANISFNAAQYTLRGMHYQREPHAEAKLVRCMKGSIYDVIIDLRPNSSTCGKWMGVELNEQNYRMLYVPEGFAHGFITLEDNTEIAYQVSEFHTPGAEQGIRWDDPNFGIQWPGEPKVISEKDRSWMDYRDTITI